MAKVIVHGAIGVFVDDRANAVRVAVGIAHGSPDPPKTANLESRLQKLIWVNDICMGCDYIGNFDIHAVDAALSRGGAS